MNENEQSKTYRKAMKLTSKPDSVIDLGQIQIEPVYRLDGVRCRGCMILIQALLWNVGTCWFTVKGKEWQMYHSTRTQVSQRGGVIRSSQEAVVMTVERRNDVIQSRLIINQKWKE